MLRNVIIITLLFILNACAGGSAYLVHGELQKAPLRLYEEIPANKAVIVMGGDVSDLRFAKNKDISRSTNSQFRAWINESYGDTHYSAVVVDPGVYHLYRIHYGHLVDDEWRIISTWPGGLDIDTEDYTYLSFSVKPGEVKYIGDLSFDAHYPILDKLGTAPESDVYVRAYLKLVRTPFVTVTVSDHFKKAQDFLAEGAKRPDLKLTKDLAKVGTNDHLVRARKVVEEIGDKFSLNDYWKYRTIFDRENLHRVEQ